MIKLGVHIEHFAALRQAGQEDTPDLVELTQVMAKNGAKAVVAGLRQDQRYPLNGKDLADLKRHTRLPLHIQMTTTPELVSEVSKIAPSLVCLVSDSPEGQSRAKTRGNSKDLAPNGSLNLTKSSVGLEVSKALESFKKRGIRTALRLDCNAQVIRMAKKMGVHGIELSTKRYSGAANKSRREEALEDLHVAGRLVRELGLELHIGHGLDYDNAAAVAEIPGIVFINIGFSIVVRSLYVGLTQAVSEMHMAINQEALNSFAALET